MGQREQQVGEGGVVALHPFHGKPQVMHRLNPDVQTLAAVRELVRYAIMTLSAMKDPDAKYQGFSQLPGHVVRDTQEAYGYSSAMVRDFRPSAQDVTQMEFFAGWLAWLRRQEGEKALRRIIGWAMGVALWRLGQREGCSADTIMNRINRSIAAMIQNFVGANIQVEIVEEPYKGAVYAALLEKPEGPHGGEVKLMKVYVSDYGFMKNGRRMRTAQENYRADKIIA